MFVAISILLSIFGLDAVFAQPFLWPHGHFDSAKLKPFDAIYLNLLAQSNLEYGGVTLKELNELSDSRKVVPRPPDLGRTRVEDDKMLDREPTQKETHIDRSHLQDSDARIHLHDSDARKHLRDSDARSHLHESDAMSHRQDSDADVRPKSPFARVVLKDSPMGDEMNPFEDIATRAPPRSAAEFRGVRRRLRGPHRHRSHHGSRHHHKHHHKTEDISLEMEPRTRRPTTPPPTLMPNTDQTTDIDQPIKIRRLPNNPFRSVDLSEPTVLKLPIPPGVEEFH